MVVAVHVDGVPAERVELYVQGAQVEYLLGPAERLEAVRVDDQRQVREAQVPGERDGLPDRALVHLAIARQAERAPAGVLVALRQGHADGDRGTVAERAARHLDTRQAALGM